jgi:hypothetical protein
MTAHAFGLFLEQAAPINCGRIWQRLVYP